MESQAAQALPYVSPWRRIAAWFIEGILFTIVLILAVAIAAVAFDGGAFVLGALAIILGFWVYFALMESSSLQGTLTKRLLGIKVTDLDGNRISFGRATVRHFSMYLTAVTPFYIGYLMVIWTKRRQSLHDYISSTVVAYREPPAPAEIAS